MEFSYLPISLGARALDHEEENADLYLKIADFLGDNLHKASVRVGPADVLDLDAKLPKPQK